jgi:bifunctional non-homologous end joining protein LigD
MAAPTLGEPVVGRDRLKVVIGSANRGGHTMTDPKLDALADYRSKRDFERTAEPSGDVSVGTSAGTATAGSAHTAESGSAYRRVFVVQKHDASRLHYDFRLELGRTQVLGVRRTFPDPADKRLAVMVEDHPLEYASFEGSIPEGEYGGGTVMLWDRGWWEPDAAWMKEAKGAGKEGSIPSPEEALAQGELKFIVHGEKLSGSWALVKTRWQGENNWLLIKHRDEAARPGSDVEKEAPDSVATGRSLERIAALSAKGGSADGAADGGEETR